jgi:hypothetical protein
MGLPAWAPLSIIAGAMLLSPVLAFLGAIAVEIVIGVLVDAEALAPLAFVAAGAIGWSLLRKLWRRQGAPRLRREHGSEGSAVRDTVPSES